MKKNLRHLSLIACCYVLLSGLTGGTSIKFKQQNELICLAENIYWESRNQSLQGKLAVAHVTLNRVKNNKFPDSICEVVKQTKFYPSGKIDLHSCQFSWYCDGKSDLPKNEKSWAEVMQIARLFLKKTPSDITEGSLWYHNTKVSPDWSNSLERVLIIEDHIFYKENT